jgi:ribose transport system ATP-binding protein
VYTRDEGEILVDGKKVSIRNRSDAAAYGIGIVFQEFSLIPALSVAENLFIGRLPHASKFKGLINYINWTDMNRKAEKALGDFGVEIDPRTKVKDLGVALKQLVEIAKALASNARILIMDEPTAALSKQEIDHLFAVIRELKAKGVSIIYISHRLGEVSVIGDRATILKDGEKVNSILISDVSVAEIVRMMIGRDLGDLYPSRQSTPGRVLLKLVGLSSKNKFQDISLDIREGEIVGITGLVGSGKTELVQAIFGADRGWTGEIIFDGMKTEIVSPRQAGQLGLGFLPEDRESQGVVSALTVRENISLANFHQFIRLGFIRPSLEAAVTSDYIRQVDIRPPDPKKKVRLLSGGNQQKVVLSKWLCSNSRLYIFDEPTRGIDIGAKIEIYKLMASLAQSGCGVLMVSSEIQEIKGMSDRVIVMHKGKIRAELPPSEFKVDDMLMAATGGDIGL